MRRFKITKGKYGNKKSKYKGRVYHSKREAGDAMWLDSLLSQGLIKQVIPQYKIPIDVNGVHITNHFVDFMVVLNNSRVVFVETKGIWTDVYRFKLRLIKALYPGIKYLINPKEKELLY